MAVSAGLVAVGDLCCRYAGVDSDRLLDAAMTEVRRHAAYVGVQSNEAAARLGLNWTQAKARLLTLMGAPKECIVCANEKRPGDFQPASTSCSHPPDVCIDCLRRHLDVEVIEKGRVAELLVCPSPDCTGSINGPDLQRLFVPGDPVIASHENRLLERALETDPNFRWCPRNGCGNGQLIDDVDSSTYWVCAKCDSRICTRHRVEFHEGLTCTEYDATLVDLESPRGAPRKSTWQSFFGWSSRRISRRSSSGTNSSSSSGGRVAHEPIGSGSAYYGSGFSLTAKRKAAAEEKRRKKDAAARAPEGSGALTAEQEAAAEEKRKEKDAAARAREAAARAREEAASLAALKRLGIKSCPKCAQGLQKADGCDHFTCGTVIGCKAQFCWLCMADWGPIIEKGNKYHKRSCRWYA